MGDFVQSDTEVGTYLNFIEGFQAEIYVQHSSRENFKDPELTMILGFVSSGWSGNMNQDELKLFYSKKNEFTVKFGCLKGVLQFLYQLFRGGNYLENFMLVVSGQVWIVVLSRSQNRVKLVLRFVIVHQEWK